KGAEKIRTLLERSNRPWQVTVHDYLAICPRINLADEDGMYCGEPDASGCRKCLRVRRSDFGLPDIAEWRNSHERLLAGAKHVLAPNEDVQERFARYFPNVLVEVRPHEKLAEPQIKTSY